MNFLKNTGLKNKKTYIKAYNYLQNGKFEESLRLFNYLLDENYRSFSILFNLITIHNELNSLDNLLNKINLLLDNEDYNYYELLIQKGNIFYLKKEYDEAIKCFDEILIDDSDNLWAKFYKTKVLWETKEECDFAKLCDIVKNNHANYYLLLLLGEFFLEVNMLDCALFCFNESIKKHSKNPTSWRDKGIVLKELNLYPESLDAFSKSLKLNGLDPITWNYKGAVYNLIGKYDSALKCFDKCLSIDPNSVPVIVNKSISYFNLGNIDNSLKYCEFALKLDSTNCHVWDNYATFLFHANRLEESLNAYNHALISCPKNITLLKNKLILLFNMGNWEDVLIFSDEILNINNEWNWVEEYKKLASEKLNN